ncbi:MAG: amino acid adenylation domain-containing protein [Acidobacteriota bacterium]|jgi:amino acid adenylation domain-containing protein
MSELVVEGYRLSPQQRTLWQQQREGARLWVHGVVELRGALDERTLERAIEAVVDRHDILRTHFFRPSGVKLPLQVVEENGHVPLGGPEEMDGPTPDDIDRRLGEILARHSEPGMETEVPALRNLLVRCEPARHLLILSLPSLCADLRTLDTLVREISLAYGGAPLDPPPEELVQYVEFAEWRHHLLAETEASEEGKRFWRDERATAAAVELPFRAGAGGAADRPASVRRTLDADTVRELEERARSWAVDEECVLLAAWQSLICRLTSRTEIEIGRVTDGRTQEELTPSLGPFAQWLPLRCSLPDEARFGELPSLIRRAVETASAWLELFDQTDPQAGDGRSPAVGFELWRWPEEYRAGGVSFRLERWESPREPFELKLLALVRGRELVVDLQYDAAKLSRDDADHLASSFEALLRDGLSHPGRLIDQLALGSADGLALLERLNDTEAEVATDRSVHEPFARQAARQPDRIAAVCGSELLSFGELRARSSRLARWLRDHGVGPETPVALVLEKSHSLVVAILGVLEAGGFYVPLDPGQPEAYRRKILATVEPAAILTTSALEDRCPEIDGPVLRLDADLEELAGAGAPDSGGWAGGGQLAYVLFTSGSTGEPKGVGVEHRQLLNYLEAIRTRFGLRPDARFGLVSSVAADLGNTVLFPPLCWGGTLHLLPDDRAIDPELAATDLRREPVDCLKIAPSHLEALLASSDPEAVLPRERLVLGGEALRRELVERARALVPECAVANHYGPTETTVGVLVRLLEDRGLRRGAESPAGPPDLGGPLANVRAYAVDSRLEPVPPWIPGELAIGGRAVTRGYLGRPELTAERFVPDPFGTAPGSRLYLTGDRVRVLPAGEIEFLGRVDDQVKIRGNRVEPDQIARHLRAYPGIENAAVVTRVDDRDLPALVAYVVSFADPPPSESDLRTDLRERLPEYMVPARFVFLDGLPLTPNGKIDRKALPEPDWSQRHSIAHFVPPRTPLEEMIAGVWEELLGIDRAGVHDDFFELGGHSLLATQLLARLRRVFEVEIPLRSLFDAPTVAELARTVEATRAAGGTGLAPPIEPLPRDGRTFPLSFSQQRVWFIEQWEVDNAAYNVAHGIHFAGALDVGALRRTFREIVRRHESLRTVFPSDAGRPAQKILPPSDVPLPVVDLRGLTPEARSRITTELTDDTGKRVIDLARGPLLRLVLLRLGEDEHQLVTVVHLMAVDGWSLGVFIREIGALYNAFVAGRPSPLQELPIQYADFAHWQREWMEGDVLRAHVDFWRDQLGTRLPVLELPTDRPRPKVQTFRGHRITAEYPRELTDRLKALSRDEGATLYVVLLTALKVLLVRYTGQDDVIVGSPTANRNRPVLEDLIGLVVSTLVLRTDLSGDPVVRDVLARVREVTLGAHDHPHVPLEHILRHLEPNKDLSHAPVFQVLFVLQNMPIPDLELEGLETGLVPVANETAKFDLEVNVWDNPDGLSLAIEYNTDVFHEEMIHRMLDHYRRLLDGIAEDCGRRLSELHLLSEGERLRIRDWSEGPHPEDEPVPVHLAFDARAQAHPGEVALEHGDERVTYGELGARARRLAHRLRERGAGPEVLVAVHLDRGPELAVALLGTLAAGAAYVPLDTDLPESRLRAVFEEARPRLVLTSGDRAPGLPEDGPEVVAVDRVLAEPEEPAEAGGEPFAAVHPDAAAYVIYTSGSTGRPKGVVVPHRALARHAAEIVRRFDLSPDDRVLQFASASFDVAAEELYPTWAAGATVVLRPSRFVSGFGAFLELVASRELSVLNLPASYWHEWVGELDRSGQPLPESLRLVVLGSEPVLTERLTAWHRLPGSDRVRRLNAYGVSEATITTSLDEPEDPPDRIAWGTLPVGRPLGGAATFVLDPHLGLTPQGVSGELCIGGAGLARGYLEDPRLTAERFVPSPWSDAPGDRLYRTGDRARWLAVGSLQLLGRIDQQLKIRGFRVEPGEIESALTRASGVREAAVVAGAGEDGRNPLRAFIVEEEPGSVTAVGLQELLRERLPAYMLPGSIELVQALPRTPTGKVDRRELLDRKRTSLSSHGALRAPQTVMERLVAAVWCDALDLERVGVDEDFFILGGHSMLATRVIARLESLLGIEIPIPVFFEAPTLTTLAPALEALLRTRWGGPEGESGGPPADRGTGPELARSQREILEAGAATGDRTPRVVSVLRLEGELDADRLARCLRELAARHECLRLVVDREGRPGTVPAESVWGEIPILERDGSGTADGDPNEPAVERELHRPFAPGEPLAGATLVKAGDADWRLVLTLHSLVADPWSVRLLTGELAGLWDLLPDDESDARSDALEAPASRFSDFARRESERLDNGAVERLEGHWAARLGGSRQPFASGGRPEGDSPRERCRLALGRELASGLDAHCRRSASTLDALLTAAVAGVVARRTGIRDLALATLTPGRSLPGTRDLVGPLDHPAMLRANLTDDPSFGELAERLRNELLAAEALHELPLDRQLAILEDPAPLLEGAAPTTLVTIDGPPERISARGLEIELVERTPVASSALLHVHLSRRTDAWSLVASWDPDALRTPSAGAIVEDSLRLLERGLEDPSAPISTLTEDMSS